VDEHSHHRKEKARKREMKQNLRWEVDGGEVKMVTELEETPNNCGGQKKRRLGPRQGRLFSQHSTKRCRRVGDYEGGRLDAEIGKKNWRSEG